MLPCHGKVTSRAKQFGCHAAMKLDLEAWFTRSGAFIKLIFTINRSKFLVVLPIGGTHLPLNFGIGLTLLWMSCYLNRCVATVLKLMHLGVIVTVFEPHS